MTGTAPATSQTITVRLGIGNQNTLRGLLFEHLVPCTATEEWSGNLPKIEQKLRELDGPVATLRRNRGRTPGSTVAYNDAPAIVRQAELRKLRKHIALTELRIALAEEFIDEVTLRVADEVYEATRRNGNLDTSVNLTAMVEDIIGRATKIPNLLPEDADERQTLLNNLRKGIVTEFGHRSR